MQNLNRTFYWTLVLFLICGIHSTSKADIVMSTSTSDSADMDFDGAGLETNGAIGTLNSITFSFSNADLSTHTGFENIQSLDVTFSAGLGYTLSAVGSGIADYGIGLTHMDEFGPNVPELNADVGEMLSISVASTSSVVGEQVHVNGLTMVDWRNFFPVSELTLTDATFDGGQNVLTGADGLAGPVPTLLFDEGVTSFSLESTGSDGIRLGNLSFSVSAVPEPSSLGFLLCAAAASALRRRPRRLNR